MITFTVPGDPVAQPRHKISTRGGFARAYIEKDHPVHAYKQAVQLAGKVAMGGQEPLDGPLSVYLEFVFERPKSHSKKRRAIYKEPHGQKPDTDNLAKAIFDALNGVAWIDDAQIADLEVSKRWASEGEGPGVIFQVQKIIRKK